MGVVGTWYESGIATGNRFGGVKNPAEREGLSGWIGARYCEILGLSEAGLRTVNLIGAANTQAWLRGFQGCSPGIPGDLTATSEPPPFEGGQCPTLYQVRLNWTESDGDTGITNQFLDGPISNIYIRPQPSSPSNDFLSIDHLGQDGNPTTTNVHGTTFGVKITSWSVHTLQRVDGQPDNCGSLPGSGPTYPDGVDLPPAPNVGDEVFPKEYIEVAPTGPDGQPYPITVEIGPATYCGNGVICVEVNGRPYKLTPEGDIVTGDEEVAPRDDEQTPTDKLDELLNEFNKEVSGVLRAEGCDEALYERAYFGTGFTGLEAMINAAVLLRTDTDLTACDCFVEEDLMPPQLLASFPQSDGIEVWKVPLSSAVRMAYLEVNGNPGSLRVYRLAGNDREADFGFWSIGYDVGNEEYNGPQIGVTTITSSLPVPPPMGRGRYARISLKKGISATLTVQEVPIDGG